MKKSTLLRKVAEETDVPYATVKRVVDATLVDIIESLQKGDRVVLSGFGTFALRPYRARQWVNPQTGRPVDIPAALRPGFMSSAALKRRLTTDSDGDESEAQVAETPAPARRRRRKAQAVAQVESAGQ